MSVNDVPPIDPDKWAAFLERLEPLTVRITGHFWPPTDEHLRECVQCQEEMHKRRIEWEVGERTS